MLFRSYDLAIEQANKALELDKNAGFVFWILGNIQVQQGNLDEAIALYERSIPLSGDSPDEPASLAYTHVQRG